MKTIHTTSFSLLAVACRNRETGQYIMRPAADLTFVICDEAPAGQSGKANDAEIVRVRVVADELRELAKTLNSVADQMDDLIEPMIRKNNPIDRHSALEIAKGILTEVREEFPKLDFEQQAKMVKSHEDAIDELAEDGWRYEDLVAEINGKGQPCEPGCGCEKPDMGPAPDEVEGTMIAIQAVSKRYPEAVAQPCHERRSMVIIVPQTGLVLGEAEDAPKAWIDAQKKLTLNREPTVKNVTHGGPISFEELVDLAMKAGATSTNGLPWSFRFNGWPVTHENDNCYLISDGVIDIRFERGQFLSINPEGQPVVMSAEEKAAVTA